MTPGGQRSLLFRPAIAILLVQTLVVALAAWQLRPLVRRHFERTMHDEVQAITFQLVPKYAAVLKQGPEQSDRTALLQMVHDDAALLGGRVTLFLGEDTVLADSAMSDAAFDRPWRRPEIARALAEGSSSLLRADIVTNEPTMYAVSVLRDVLGGRTTLRFGRSLTATFAWVDELTLACLLAGALLIGVTASGLGLAATLVRIRARSISKTMTELARGNLRTRFTPSSDAEFAPITKSLNALTTRLADHVEQLQAQQNMHKAILQSMGSAVIALDVEQRILDLNSAAERMLDCDAEASRGRLLHEVVRNARLHRFVEESMSDSSTPSIEFSIDPDGRTIIEADSEQLISSDGRPRGLLVVMSDVTRLRRLESLRSDFAANVSHELRTPITNIKGYVETLLDVGLADQEQARKFLEIVNRNSNRLAAIIDDVMTLAKLEQPHARDTLEKSLRPVSHIVRSVVGQFERMADGKKITIRTNVPDGLRVVVHGPLIEQALGNLVSNAINYSPSNTVVTVSAKQVNSQVELAVEDQGPGIAKLHQDRLFERFYRVDKARSREVGGTGLGLALVKHIALVHGGNVTVESDLGHGSVFRLLLPGT